MKDLFAYVYDPYSQPAGVFTGISAILLEG